MAKSLVIWVIQVPWQWTKWRCHRCISGDGVTFMLLLEKIRLHLGYKGSQRVLIQYASHTPQTNELSLVLWSTVSQNLRPLGAARTMWVYFTLCQQSTLKKSKLGVRLVLEVLDETDGQRKFELGIPQRQGATYIRGAPYIRDKTVIWLQCIKDFFFSTFLWNMPGKWHV